MGKKGETRRQGEVAAVRRSLEDAERRGDGDGQPEEPGGGDRAPRGGPVGGGAAAALAIGEAQLLLRGHPRRVLPASPPLAR